MKTIRQIALASTALLTLAGTAQAADGVVASIKPVHSLVAAVMEGVGEPALIVGGAGSPHTYALRPSEAAALEQARLVFWVGEGLETFLKRPLETLAGNATVVELSHAHGLIELAYREGGPFETHDHDEDGHDHAAHDDADDGHEHAAHDHDDDGHEHAAHDNDDDGHEHAAHDNDDDGHEHAAHDHDDDGHEHAAHDNDDDGHEHAAHDHAHADGHDHSHEGVDMHLWLDPVNAKAFVHEIEEALVALDPDNAARYEANAEAVWARLDALIAETEAALAPVKDRRFVVFHDAYQYFENRFGLTAAGSITVSPEVLPGAQRIAEIRARVAELGATCVFAEPQFEPRLVTVVTEGSDARAGVLDPLGAEIEDGPELYFQLIRNLTTSIATCLADAS